MDPAHPRAHDRTEQGTRVHRISDLLVVLGEACDFPTLGLVSISTSDQDLLLKGSVISQCLVGERLVEAEAEREPNCDKSLEG